MGIVILPFFLIAVPIVLAIVDVATMRKAASAMSLGRAPASTPPPPYRSNAPV